MINRTVCTSLVSAKWMFSFEQELGDENVRLIADSCQHLKKLSLFGFDLLDDDVIHVIDRLGKQLTVLVLGIARFTDVAFSYLKNCAR